MKLTVIAEGSTKWDRLIRKWGISCLIDCDILFDTFGRTDLFKKNLSKLKIDVNKIKTVILSHEHWDHITGLKYLTDNNKNITIYIPEGFNSKITAKISAYGSAAVIKNSKITQIKENIYLSDSFCCSYDGKTIYEQSLIVKTEKGMTLICGCAHPGIDVIVSNINEHFNSEVTTLIGGFHLADNSEQQNEIIINSIKYAGIKKIAPMHCTGKKASELIKKHFKTGFIKISEGCTLEI